MKHKASGTEGVLLALALAIAFSALNFFTGDPVPLQGDLGICLPSPNHWDIMPLWSWIINLVLILGFGLTIHFVNKTHSVVQSTDTVIPAATLVMVMSNLWIDTLLNTSTILMWMNLFAIIMMYSAYKERNATQQVFVVATILSLGSMMQYAFLFFIPAYMIIGIMLKCFRIKEFIAFILGLAAPYWVAIGLGLVSLDDFTMPQLTNLFGGSVRADDIFFQLLNIGFTAFLAIILTLNNAVKLYAGNTRRRLFNNALAVLGIVSLIAMIVDFNNLPAYLGTFYFTVAVQLASFFALRPIHKAHIWLLSLAAVYVAFFCLAMYA